MNETIYVISDIEMGKKDLYDDFKDSDKLVSFLESISESDQKTTLVLNGDTFDYLKMDYQGEHTPYITQEISLWKTEQIIQKYPEIFAALGNFLKKTNHFLHFNIGNHDQDLVWPRVQNLIRKTIGHPKQISYDFVFSRKDLQVEHGHLQDYFYIFNRKKPYLKHNDQNILNIPYGTYAIIKFFMELKKKYPELEKFYPRHLAFKAYPQFKKDKRKLATKFIISSLIPRVIKIKKDPINRPPYLNLFKHILNFGFTALNDQKFKLHRFRMIERRHPDKKYIIMGHLHLEESFASKRNAHCLITDTWREEYCIDENKKLRAKNKTYAIAQLKNDHVQSIQLLRYHHAN